MSFRFQNTYRSLPDKFYKLVNPEPAQNPVLLFFNQSLAKDLGLPPYNGEISRLLEDSSEHIDYASYLSGSKLLEGSEPLAQAYAGHQFAHFTTLGDGRAHLLGEHLTPSGQRVDVQLKGSGRTPYSRGGDGRATAPAMLREYIMSEAMNSLGIPTTRSLAVVLTNIPVYREEVNHGAVLTRISSSHIRVGTFECAYHLLEESDLKALAEYAIERHHPDLKASENSILEFFREVVRKQVNLIVDWMRVGFIHGVMNTDNMSIAGETIDYGPCAFMNSYDPSTVFSSIDRNGRYAFGNQPAIAQWNLACLANSLLPLIDSDSQKAVEKAKGILDWYAEEFDSMYWKMMGEKIGFSRVASDERQLIDDLRSWMKNANADYTNTFLAIESLYCEEIKQAGIAGQLEEIISPKVGFDAWKTNSEFIYWFKKWKSAIEKSAESPRSIINRMQKMNPFTIPRNHLVEVALDPLRKDTIRLEDLDTTLELIHALEYPYHRKESLGTYQLPPDGGDEGYKTFCGT